MIIALKISFVYKNYRKKSLLWLKLFIWKITIWIKKGIKWYFLTELLLFLLEQFFDQLTRKMRLQNFWIDEISCLNSDRRTSTRKRRNIFCPQGILLLNISYAISWRNGERLQNFAYMVQPIFDRQHWKIGSVFIGKSGFSSVSFEIKVVKRSVALVCY